MKFSEVIKALEDGSRKTYEANSGFKKYQIEIDENGYFKFESIDSNGIAFERYTPAGGFTGNISQTLDWQEFRMPITYQKAFERWVQGYKVWFKDKFNNVYEVDQTVFQFRGSGIISRADVEFSTWYTEEVEAF